MLGFTKGAFVGATLMAAAGAAAAFSGLMPAPGPRAEAPPADAVVSALEEIVVDIRSRGVTGEEARRFLKADLALVYANEDAAARAAAEEMRLRDAFVDYLRQLDERDLLGSVGLARLRADLLHRAHVILGEDAPAEVLVADLVVQ